MTQPPTVQNQQSRELYSLNCLFITCVTKSEFLTFNPADKDTYTNITELFKINPGYHSQRQPFIEIFKTQLSQENNQNLYLKWFSYILGLLR
jgi:hypothetical protein